MDLANSIPMNEMHNVLFVLDWYTIKILTP